jgi:nucleoside-diphosphate-sugar epimerase
MKVFVIGASGYVGSHVARRFLRDGCEVVGLSRHDRGDRKLTAWGITPVRGDAEDIDTLKAPCQAADVTVFAPQLLLAPEQQAVTAILSVLESTGKSFIFTSGTGVLSWRTDGAWAEESYAEDDAFTPYEPMRMRVETEQIVREAGCGKGLRAMVIRPPMIWGNNGCDIVQRMLQSIQKTGACCYVGAGLNLYSNVHIMDLVEVYALAVAKGTAGALYHAVSGEVNYRTMAESIARVQGVAARSITAEVAAKVWGKFFTGLVFAACSRSRCPRTRTELGWVPSYLDVTEMFAQPYVAAVS